MSDIVLELKRQGVHLVGGVCIAILTYILKPVYGFWTVIPVLIGVSFFSVLPKLGGLLHIHNHLIENYERKKDLDVMPYKGAIHYGLGVAPAIALLDTGLACAVIMVLSVGDSISTIVGKTIGRTPVGFQNSDGLFKIMDQTRFRGGMLEHFFMKIRRTHTGYKTLEGFVGFIFGGFIGALFFTGIPEALFLASLGAIVELLVPLDDNVSIPWSLTLIALLVLP